MIWRILLARFQRTNIGWVGCLTRLGNGTKRAQERQKEAKTLSGFMGGWVVRCGLEWIGAVWIGGLGLVELDLSHFTKSSLIETSYATCWNPSAFCRFERFGGTSQKGLLSFVGQALANHHVWWVFGGFWLGSTYLPQGFRETPSRHDNFDRDAPKTDGWTHVGLL